MQGLIKIYNFFYSKIYFHYKKIGEQSMPGLYALCFLSLFESLNVLSIFFIYVLFYKFDLNKIDNKYGYLIFLFIFFLNYRYFYLKKGKQTSIKEYNVQRIPIKKYKIYFYSYIITSL